MLEVTLKHGNGAVETIRLDDSHKELDVQIDEDAEVSCRFVRGNGRIDPTQEAVVLKAAMPKAKPAPKPAPAPKAEPKPEPRVEPKPEPVVEEPKIEPKAE